MEELLEHMEGIDELENDILSATDDEEDDEGMADFDLFDEAE